MLASDLRELQAQQLSRGLGRRRTGKEVNAARVQVPPLAQLAKLRAKLPSYVAATCGSARVRVLSTFFASSSSFDEATPGAAGQPCRELFALDMQPKGRCTAEQAASDASTAKASCGNTPDAPQAQSAVLLTVDLRCRNAATSALEAAPPAPSTQLAPPFDKSAPLPSAASTTGSMRRRLSSLAALTRKRRRTDSAAVPASSTQSHAGPSSAEAAQQNALERTDFADATCALQLGNSTCAVLGGCIFSIRAASWRGSCGVGPNSPTDESITASMCPQAQSALVLQRCSADINLPRLEAGINACSAELEALVPHSPRIRASDVLLRSPSESDARNSRPQHIDVSTEPSAACNAVHSGPGAPLLRWFVSVQLEGGGRLRLCTDRQLQRAGCSEATGAAHAGSEITASLDAARLAFSFAPALQPAAAPEPCASALVSPAEAGQCGSASWPQEAELSTPARDSTTRPGAPSVGAAQAAKQSSAVQTGSVPLSTESYQRGFGWQSVDDSVVIHHSPEVCLHLRVFSAATRPQMRVFTGRCSPHACTQSEHRTGRNSAMIVNESALAGTAQSHCRRRRSSGA